MRFARNLLPLAALAAALVARGDDASLAPSALLGWWGGDAEHGGERRRVVMEFAEADGKPVARLTLASIGLRDLPVGAWRIDGRRVIVGQSFELALADGELEGVLPKALVPLYQIPFALRRLEGPDPVPPAQDASPPRPAVAWTVDLHAPIWAGLAHDPASGALVVATDQGAVFALSERTGRVIWTARAGGAVRATPTIDRGCVYVPSDDGRLQAFLLRTGRLLWRTSIGKGKAPRVPSGPTDDRYERYASSVVVKDGRAYVGSRDGGLYAIDARSGRVVWRAAAGDVISGAAAVAGDAVIFGSYDGHVRAVAARNGLPRWDVDAGGAIVSDVVVADGRALVGTRSYELLALDEATGASAWKRYVWFSWIESPPVVRDHVAYHGSSDALRVFAVALDGGRLVWEREVPGWSWARPSATAGSVFVGTVGNDAYFSPRRGALLALDRAGGELRWALPADPSPGEWGFAASPVAVGKRVYAADLRGRVFAIEAGE